MKTVLRRSALVVVWGCLALGFLFAEPSYAIIRFDWADDQDHIDYGNQFDSTSALAFTVTDDDGQTWRYFYGSCVVIDDGHWVLTAAHCVVDESTGQDFGESYTVITGPDPWDLEVRGQFVADQWWVHPDFVSIGSGPDLALLYFEDAITGLTPATRFRGTVALNTTISIVGFGEAGTPSTGWLRDSTDDNVRRGCQAPIYYGLGSEIDAGALFWDFLGPLSGKAAPGDSGGPWFVDHGGTQQLMGITSNMNGNWGYGTTWATRVSLFNDWIDDIQFEVLGGGMDNVTPEPSALLLLAAGGVVVVLFLRKRSTG